MEAQDETASAGRGAVSGLQTVSPGLGRKRLGRPHAQPAGTQGPASRRGWRSDAGASRVRPGGGGRKEGAAAGQARTVQEVRDVAEKLKAAREGTGERVPGRKGA